MNAFKLTNSPTIIRTSDDASIPPDPNNRDYADFLLWRAAGNVPDPADPIPAPPQQILSQDLMAQFTTADATAIQAAITGNVQFWLLWSAMQAQKDPMVVTNARFLAGWSALIQVLGQPRMDAVALALNVKIA